MGKKIKNEKWKICINKWKGTQIKETKNEMTYAYHDSSHLFHSL